MSLENLDTIERNIETHKGLNNEPLKLPDFAGSSFADDSFDFRSKKGGNKLPELKMKPETKTRQRPRKNSDSDNEVLNELTRNTDFVVTGRTAYPESYAKKLQNQQYKRQTSDLLREKTIVRDPDEWAFEYNKRERQEQIKSNPSSKQQEEHNYTVQPPHQSGPTQSTPHYDVSEEMLMDEIEKEFL